MDMLQSFALQISKSKLMPRSTILLKRVGQFWEICSWPRGKLLRLSTCHFSTNLLRFSTYRFYSIACISCRAWFNDCVVIIILVKSWVSLSSFKKETLWFFCSLTFTFFIYEDNGRTFYYFISIIQKSDKESKKLVILTCYSSSGRRTYYVCAC